MGTGRIQIGFMMKEPFRITLRINILTLFLTLVIIAFAAVLLFMKYKNYESIDELTENRMRSVAGEIDGKIDDLFSAAEDLIEGSAPLFTIPSEELLQNSNSLRQYMLAVEKNYDNIAYFYVANPEGVFLEVGDVRLLSRKTYASHRDPLPKDATFNWSQIEPLGDKYIETILYYNRDLKQVGSETYEQTQYDPRTRPWYIGAKETRKLYWTDIYLFYETKNWGVTASLPLYNDKGEFLGVVGADLSFELLSRFLLNQTIGKHGKAFIVDSTGRIVIPDASLIHESPLDPNAASEALLLYKSEGENNFQLTFNSKRYIAHIEPFPVKLKKDWALVMLVPFDDFFAEFENTQHHAFLIVLLILGLSSIAVFYFARRISKPIVILSREIDKIRQMQLYSDTRVESRIREIHLMDESIASMRSAVRSFARYVPKEIVHRLFSQHKEIELGGEKKEVTVLFTDIADFTTITEEQPTDLLMKLLAEYFDGLSKIILENQGTIDKYIGDSIMAFWNAPAPVEDHTALCAETVLRCVAYVHAFNDERRKKGEPIFHTRFGINTGVAIAGNIGTPERMNYTLMGDIVNTASRLQNKNKDYGTEILISEEVAKRLEGRYTIRLIDHAEVKGKKDKLALYELIGRIG